MGEGDFTTSEVGHANAGCLPMIGMMVTVAVSVVIGVLMLLF